MDATANTQCLTSQPRTLIERTIETACDIAANGLPIGKDARLVAKVDDLNHGDGRPKPAAVIGIDFSF